MSAVRTQHGPLLSVSEGFPSVEAMMSFALALGIREGRKGTLLWNGKSVDIESLDSYPAASLIHFLRNGGPEDPLDMRKEMEGFLSGGLEIIEEYAKGRKREIRIEIMIKHFLVP